MFTIIRQTILKRVPFLSSSLLFCLCMALLTSCESKTTIVNSLDEKDANEILVFLESRNIPAEKMQALTAGAGSKEIKWDISVKTQDASEAMRLLNQQGLPRRSSQNLLNVFSTTGLVPSDLQEKIRYRAALAAELASTIRKYEGVLDADVVVSFPEEDPLNPGKMKGKITAAVWVKHSGVLDDPNSHMVPRIKRFVASAVTGLNPDDVTVIGERSRLGDAKDNLTGTLVEPEKQYENVWSIIVAKNSVGRFQTIFFAFTIAVLILLLALVWFFWKTHLLLGSHGGFKSLFSIHPYSPKEEAVQKKEDETLKVENKEGAKVSEPPKSLVDKNIDET